MNNLGSSKDIFYFLTGAAGTGKTYTIKNEINRNPMFGLVTATTGIAAINIGGVTVNSVLGFYNDEDLYYKYKSGDILARLKKIKEIGYISLIIDEVSMLSSLALDILYNCVEELNSKNFYKLRLILVGDLLQLPPVNTQGVLEAESWKYFKVNLLKEVKRQSNSEFITALNSIRLGKKEEAAEYLIQSNVFLNEVDRNFKGTTLFSKNKEVDEYNNHRLNLINKPFQVYKRFVEGQASSDWKNIPEEVILKEDALVMLLANAYDYNDSEEENKFLNSEIRYANGDLGICKHLSRSGIIVELIRTGQQVLVQPITRYNEVFSGNIRKKIGRVTYLPVRLAYGSTLHKSQGLTLDNVQIDINSNFISKIPGALYVAISRARNIEGLKLVGNRDLFIKRCTIDKKISKFYEQYT